MCIKLGLIEGNTLFVDGSKIRAAASINNTWSEEKCARYLNKIEQQIVSILKESEAIDEKEQEQESLVKLRKELSDKEALKSKIESILQELKSEDKKSINSTDPECVKVKGRQGTHAGYNGQIAVDEKHGLIVNSDVVDESTDRKQFTNQINQANQVLDEPCKNACADAGYASTTDLKETDKKNIHVIVPSQNQANGKVAGKFDKANFAYDEHKDCYICPAGQEIPYSHFSTKKQHKSYRFKDAKICFACQHYGICTDSKRGRTVTRLPDEETKQKLERQYKTELGQAIYKLRKQKVELPFGHIKRNLGVNAFLLRGLAGVRAEMSLLSTCFNISRMITLLGGVKPLLTQIAI
jgi:hypothetical protein